MNASVMAHPLEIDQLTRMVLSGECLDVERGVRHVVAISSEATASGAKRFGLDRRVIVDGATCSEKRADAIRKPERGKDVSHFLRVSVSDVAFRVHQGNVGGKAVLPPHVKDVADEFRFAVKIGPDDLARRKRIVLKTHERQIRETVSRFQIVDEPAKP